MDYSATLSGFFVVAVFLPNAKRDAEIKERLDRIDVATRGLQEQIFRSAIVFGKAENASICRSCGNMIADVGQCCEFKRRINTPVLKCTLFVPDGTPDDTGAK